MGIPFGVAAGTRRILDIGSRRACGVMPEHQFRPPVDQCGR